MTPCYAHCLGNAADMPLQVGWGSMQLFWVISGLPSTAWLLEGDLVLLYTPTRPVIRMNCCSLGPIFVLGGLQIKCENKIQLNL